MEGSGTSLSSALPQPGYYRAGPPYGDDGSPLACALELPLGRFHDNQATMGLRGPRRKVGPSVPEQAIIGKGYGRCSGPGAANQSLLGVSLESPSKGGKGGTAASPSDHVIWGSIEHESQDSLATPYGSCGDPNISPTCQVPHGSRKKLQNKRLTTDGILFLDSMSSGGISEGSHGIGSRPTSAAVSKKSDTSSSLKQCYVYSAEAYDNHEHPELTGVEDVQLYTGECDNNDRSSGEESDDSQDQAVQQQQREQQARQQAFEAENIDMEALLEQVPLDEAGNKTSIGSIGHAEGECKTHCAFVLRTRGCMNGVNCLFCHFPHSLKKARQRHKFKLRPRPCKGKRDKYRKHWEDLKNQVEENPADFDPESVELPASISTYDKLRAKLVSRLQTHKSAVLAEQGARQHGTASGSDPSKSAGQE